MDLREFLFGAERSALTNARPVLADLQSGRCFYCEKPIRAEAGEVDHFIPWAKYPADLAYNLVLADRRCNGQKRDRLPHVEHLAHWRERNRAYEGPIAAALENRLPCDLASTERIAYCAYAQTESAGGLTWRRGEELSPLSPAWRSYLGVEYQRNGKPG